LQREHNNLAYMVKKERIKEKKGEDIDKRGEREKRQRNTAQMKKQSRDSWDQINREEISNLPEREFRRMIVKMLWRLENKMEKI